MTTIKKKLKKYLRFKSPSVKVTYSMDAKGEIDVDKMIEQKPFWKVIKPGSSNKPKKVIFTDLSANLLNDTDSIEELMELMIKEGREQGTEFYIWTGQLTQLNTSHILHHQLIDLLKKTSPISHKDLLAQLTTGPNKIAQDEIEIIDFIRARQILSLLHNRKNKVEVDLDSVDKRGITPAMFQTLVRSFHPKLPIHLACKSTKQKDLLLTALNFAPHVSHLLLSFYSFQKSEIDGFIDELEKQQNNFDKIKSLTIYSELNSKQLERLLSLFPNIKSLKISDFGDFSIPQQFNVDLKNLKHLNCQGPVVNIENLIAHAPNIEKLYISGCSVNEVIPLPNIKELRLEHVEISEETLNEMLDSYENLSQFKVSDLPKVKSIKTNKIHQELKEIKINRQEIDAHGLNNFLTYCPNVTQLYLQDCTIQINEELKDFSADLNQLTDLEFWNCDPIDEYSLKILKCCPNLKSLNISQSKLFLENVQFDELEEFSLSNGSLSESDLRKIFNQSQTIKLYSCDIDGFSLSSKTEQFEKVKELRIFDCKFKDEAIISKFLSSCPNLERFNLNCRSISDSKFLTSTPFPQLTQLRINSFNLDVDQFNQFLQNAPNLLEIAFRTYPEDLFCDMNKLKLNEKTKIILENKEFKSNTITDEKLKDFLLHSEGLEKLDLSNNAAIEGDFYDDERIDLSSITKLNLSNTKVSPQHLAKMLQKMPNLKKLDCKNIFHDKGKSFGKLLSESAADLWNFKLKIEEIDLSDNHLSLEHLSAFLRFCPELRTLKITNTSLELDQLEMILDSFPNITIEAKHLSDEDFTNPKAERIPDNSAHNLNFTNRRNNPGKFDTNTSLTKNGPLHAQQIFAYKSPGEPHVSSYRLLINTKQKIGPKIESLSIQHLITEGRRFNKSKDIAEIYKKRYAHTKDVFYGRINVPFKDSEWHPLPSLSSADEILDLSADIPLQLGYCEEESLYYVKPLTPLTKGQVVDIRFLVKAESIPKTEYSKKQQEEAKKIFKDIRFSQNGEVVRDENFEKLNALTPKKKLDLLVAFCHGFGEKGLTSKIENDIDGLNALINEANGACRHRTWVFMALAEALGIQARSVENDCHAFVEVYQNTKKGKKGKWIKKDLGGHDVDLKIEPMPNAAPKAQLKPQLKPIAPIQDIPEGKKEEDKPNANPTVRPNFTIRTPNVINPNAVPRADNPFITWDNVKSNATNFKEYFDEIITKAESLPGNQRNILILLDDDQIELFHQHVTQYYKDSKKNSYYLNTLENVTEKAANIHSDGGFEKVDSSLMQFVKQAKEGDALISNWSDYKSAFVGYNAMMDETRKIKTTAIPEGALVISILRKNQADRLGEDFYSRFRIKSECIPLEDTNLIQNLKLNEKDAVDNLTEINFYDPDWKKYLLGTINIQGKKFEIEKAALVDAIKNNSSGVLLVNAPWNLSEFRLFISEILIKRKFYFNGQEVKLPENFQIKSTKKEYDLSHENLDILITAQEKTTDFHLNSETFNNFFKIRRCENDLLFTDLGWLERNRGKTISVYVSETLSVSQWTKLLAAAKNAECELQLKLAPNVTIPTVDMAKVPKDETPALVNDNIYVTNDLEYAEERVLKAHPKALVVSVNFETMLSDLIEKTKPKNLDEGWLFESTLSDIYKKLENGDTVILKGSISTILAKQLETLLNNPPSVWINGKQCFPKGKLILITDSQDVFTYTKTQEITAKSDMCWQLLEEIQTNRNDKDLLEEFKQYAEKIQKDAHMEFSYGQLRNMFEKLKAGNFSNPFKPYLRLHPDEKLLLAKHVWSPKKAMLLKPDFDNIVEKRQHKITSELAHSPYLFIAGPSGVGKSTHILTELEKDGDHKLFEGIEKLKAWLIDPDSRKHVLFIDEANLEQEGFWDIFEGLFNKTPNILLDGVLYPITPQHKVIFAGNYNYFAGRQEHKFFERHGQVFNFKELPEEAILKKVILPALETAKVKLNADELEKVAKLLFKIYTDANKHFDDHPLTLRNLKMMAKRFGLYFNEYKSILGNQYTVERLASVAAVEELKAVVSDIDPFLKAFSLKHFYTDFCAKLTAQIPKKINEFIVTDSRKETFRSLQDLFIIREKQLKNTDQAKYLLPGFLIEGPAGIGKSKMVIEYLHALGFKKGDENAPNKDSTKCYYHLTPTDPEKMEKILVKAFHEGAVVVVDELNSLPLERIINQLLSETEGQKGFFLIGTQNPVTFTGRQVLSKALENRFNKVYLSDYPEKELRYIACQICPDQMLANEIVTDYIIAKNFAQKHQKTPEPTPRDLFQYLAQVAKPAPGIYLGKEEIKISDASQVNSTLSLFNPFKILEPSLDKEETIKAEPPPKDFSDEINTICREDLAAIVKKIKDYTYTLNGGGVPVTEDRGVKYYSHSAANIKDLIESSLKSEKRKLTHKTFDHIATEIEIILNRKLVAKKGSWFLNIGAREQGTVDLYWDILKLINVLGKKLEKYDRPKPKNDDKFGSLPRYVRLPKISRNNN